MSVKVTNNNIVQQTSAGGNPPVKKPDLSEQIFAYIENHVAAIGDDELNKLLKKINKDNVIAIIKRFDAISKKKSIIKIILDEVGSTDKEMKEALLGAGNGKETIRGIFTLLLDKAADVGVDAKTISTYKKSFETELDKQLGKGIGLFINSDKLDTIMRALIQTIENQTNTAPEIRTQIAATPATRLQAETINVLVIRYNKALNDFNNQLLQDGWAGDAADGISRIWNNPVGEYFGLSTGNTANQVRKDLAACSTQINKLKAAREKGDQAFRDEFYNVFHIAYNATNVRVFQDIEKQYVLALQAKNQEDLFNSQFKLLLSKSPLMAESEYVMSGNHTSEYVIKATKQQVFDREYKKIVDLLGEGGEALLESKFNEAQAKTIEQKYVVLQKLVLAVSDTLAQTTSKVTGGKGVAAIEKRYQNAYKAAFGLENDILKRVNDYNISQQKGAGAIKSAVVIGVMTAVAVSTAATGGLSAPATAGVVALTTATTEITDRATSGAALKAGREDGFLAYLKAANKMTDWNQVATVSLSSGLMTLVFAGQTYAVTNLCKAANMGGVATAITNTGATIATGLGAEYLMTGEISVRGATFTVLFAVVNGIVQIKQIKAQEAMNAQQQADKLAADIKNAREILGISQDTEITSLDQIKQIKHDLALKYHPDRGGSQDMMAMINSACDVLTQNFDKVNINLVKTVRTNTTTQQAAPASENPITPTNENALALIQAPEVTVNTPSAASAANQAAVIATAQPSANNNPITAGPVTPENMPTAIEIPQVQNNPGGILPQITISQEVIPPIQNAAPVNTPQVTTENPVSQNAAPNAGTSENPIPPAATSDANPQTILADNTGAKIELGNIEEINIIFNKKHNKKTPVIGTIQTPDGQTLQIRYTDNIQIIDEYGNVINLGTVEEIMTGTPSDNAVPSEQATLKARLRAKVANQLNKTKFGRKIVQGVRNAKKAVKTKATPVSTNKSAFYEDYLAYKDNPVSLVQKGRELYNNPDFIDLSKRWVKHMAATGQNHQMVSFLQKIITMSDEEKIQYLRTTRKIPADVPDEQVLHMVRSEIAQGMIETAGVGPTKFAQIISNTTEVMDAIGDKSPSLRAAIENTRNNCHPTRTLEEAQAFVDASFPEDCSVILFYDEQNPIISPNQGHKYTLIKQMGTASMGETYLAKRYDGTQCVIKLLKKGVDAEQLQLEEELYTMLIQTFNPDPESAASQIATIHQCYKDWADELDFTSERDANAQLAAGAQRYSVAKVTDLSPDGKCLVMDLAEGIQMSKVKEMLAFYKEHPDEYATKYAKEIVANPWLADPEQAIASLPELITRTFDEQFMFIKANGKSLMHGDPHMGNYFVKTDADGNLMLEFIDTGLCVERSGEMIIKDIKFFSDYLVGNSKGVAEYYVDQCDLTGVDRAQVLESITQDIQNEIFNKQTNVTNILTTQVSITTILDRYGLELSPANATAIKAEMQFFTAIRDVAKLNGGSLDLGPIFRDVPSALLSMMQNSINPIEPIREAMRFALENPEQTLSTAYQFKALGKKDD